MDTSKSITIYIDSSLPVFSSRLVQMMEGSGIHLKELPIPKNRWYVLLWAWKLFRSKIKIIHYLYFGEHHPLIYIISKLLGKTVLVHWIGTDVLYATTNTSNWFGALLRKLAYKMTDQHLAVFEPLANELKPLGIQAKVISLPPNIPPMKEDITWPTGNCVFVYLPEERQKFYGSDITFSLIKEMPDVKFVIAAHSGKNAPQLPNVEYLGWTQDIEYVWKRTKVYLRLTKHDGLSHTVVEALARAKHVIWSCEFPCSYQAHSFNEAKEALVDIFSKNKPNINGMNYVYANFQSLKLTQDYKKIYTHYLKYKN